jgi:seryl-tRNA synthetase
VRFRRADRQLEPVHTLNGTAVTARVMIALMENFQDEGGSISVPGAPLEVRRARAPRRIKTRA